MQRQSARNHAKPIFTYMPHCLAAVGIARLRVGCESAASTFVTASRGARSDWFGFQYL